MTDRIRDLTAEQIRTLNSATQYPSILTYHVLGERGRLTEERTAAFASGSTYVTEKIDGTNARIVIPPMHVGAPLIGSRNELLHYLDDVIANPAQGIVDAVREIAETLPAHLMRPDRFVVAFGEVYGGKTTAGAKNYSTTGTVGFRMFDIAHIPLDVLTWDAAKAAAWRDGAGQDFIDVHALEEAVDRTGVLSPPRVLAPAPPESVADTHEWLSNTLRVSYAVLDDTGRGRPEGVVVRTADRSQIVKIRYEDYERTAKAAKRGAA